MKRPKDLEIWARTQNRITNGRICYRFNVDEETAHAYYCYLKWMGIIGRMGYVNKEITEKMNMEESK